MVVTSEDAVVIQPANNAGEPTLVTVNCPNQTGLGCDICRIILEFGLYIKRADMSTDGQWCYVLFWVFPRSASTSIQWTSLKDRLMSVCPPFSIPFYYELLNQPKALQVYLLKLISVDRKDLLHDVTKVLSELDLLIHRVKASTTPDGRAVNLFFVIDGMDLLHTKKRQDEACRRLRSILREYSIICEIELAQGFQQGFSSLPPEIANDLFKIEFPSNEVSLEAVGRHMNMHWKNSVKIDNSLSPSHTLLQIHCVDQKGLTYDILRTLKDCNIQIVYGRFLSDMKGSREVDLFILQDGKKIVDIEKQDSLCSRLRLEMLHHLRVMIVNRGPDAELFVANPVEMCGRGRPLVFYDVTTVLKVLGIHIFSAEIGRHATPERQWEVYRFLLNGSQEISLLSSQAKNQIVERVRRTLMGW